MQPPMEEQSEREERTEEPPQKAQEDKIRRSKQKELPQQQKVSYKTTQKFKKDIYDAKTTNCGSGIYVMKFALEFVDLSKFSA